MQANYRFTASPNASSVKRVAGGDEHVGSITGDAAVSPNSATDGARCPGRNVGRIVDRNTHHPAVISAAISPVTGVGYIDNSIDQPQSSTLVLNIRIKNRAVVCRHGIHIHWPARISLTGIDVQRKNEMLLSRAARCDCCIKKERSGRKIDNGRAGDSARTDITARRC